MEDTILDELKPSNGGEEAPANLPILEEMGKAGIFLGHKKAKTHPRMRPFVFTTRNGLEIIDLPQTLEAVERAAEILKSKVATGGSVLLVGTTPAAKAVVEEFAKKFNFPYVNERWLGGTLTNFKTLAKRIAYFKKLRADRQAGKFEKYTKKERLDIDREIAKLTLKFSGTENMEVLPQLMFVVDVNANLIAIREAKRTNIPVVAIVNTDADPALVDYPVPANDRSKMSLEWIFSKMETAVNEARSQKPIA